MLNPNPPRMITVVAAAGLLGTFVGALPAIAGFSGETIGAWSLVLAAVVLLLGTIFEGI
jgi:hypothetical protein